MSIKEELKEIICELSYEEREVTLASGPKNNFILEENKRLGMPRGGLLVWPGFSGIEIKKFERNRLPGVRWV